MSTTVKVFIVLNLLMALGFMYAQMVQFATRENYKRRWNEDTAALTKANIELANQIGKESLRAATAENLIQNLETKAKTAQDEVAAKVAELKARAADIDSKDGEINKLRDQLNARMSELAQVNESLKQARQRNTELNHIAQVARAAAFSLNVKLSEVEDDRNAQQNENTKLQELINSTQKQLDKANAIVSLLQQRFPNQYRDLVSNPTGVGFLSGVVAGVKPNPSGEQDLVVISIGADSKLEEGVELIVARGAQYLCKVRVERIANNMATCRVIPDSWNREKKQAIQVGDVVQNRF